MKNIFRLSLLLLMICGAGIICAEEQIELIAPGGGEMDLNRNLMKYYSSGSNKVRVLWSNSTMEAGYLEYYRDQDILKGKDGIKMTQKKPVTRVLKCVEITVDLKKDFFAANKEVFLNYDENTSFSGNSLEWDRKNDQIKFLGKPEIVYKDWKILGERIEGQVTKGVITIFGPVHAFNGDNNVRCGKMIFEREQDLFTLQDNPVVVRGKNEMTATEIYYDLKTKKVTANGEVKTRTIE